MAAAKKPATKRKIQARDVEVGNRSLEAVLADLAERSVRAEERSAKAEELAQVALQTIGAVLRDLHALAERTDRRLGALEQAAE